jgi:DNA-binding MarR family transcriptional regulator
MKPALIIPPEQMLDYETAGSGRHKNLRMWLRLLTCTMLIETKIRGQLERHFSVTLPQFDLMAQLDRVPDGLTMSALSERLMVSNGNVTGIVARLVADDLVERQAAKTDRRSFVVRLSPKGRLIFREMAERHEGWINQMFEDLSAADIASLMQVLAKTKHSVRSTVLEPPSQKVASLRPAKKSAAPRKA